jgi:hypothetical protein
MMTNIITVTDVTARPNEALRGIWEGSTMVGGKRVVCEEGQGDGEEEEQTDNIATLLPTNNYSRDILQRLPRASAGGWGGSWREFTVWRGRLSAGVGENVNENVGMRADNALGLSIEEADILGVGGVGHGESFRQQDVYMMIVKHCMFEYASL